VCIIPTVRGTDLFSEDGRLDGHVRIETYKQVGTRIFVDLFDSSIKDADEAHLLSDFFQLNEDGALQATSFLKRFGFNVIIKTRPIPKSHNQGS